MILNILFILAFIGILLGLSKLLKAENFDLDNENDELIKCSSCGKYLPKGLAINYPQGLFCKNCKP